MWPFKRKQPVDASEFCRGFLDQYIFGIGPRGIDMTGIIAESAYRGLCEIDASFSSVSLTTFKDEFIALWLEVANTAWTHQSKPAAAVKLSETTKKCLEERNRADLWEVVTDYNGAVARSSLSGIDTDSPAGQAKVNKRNVARADFFDEWYARGHDGYAVGRVANRIGTETGHNTKRLHVYTALNMLRRLEREKNDACIERLLIVSYGFYQGAKEALDNITLTA